jgi:hypothetical protein
MEVVDKHRVADIVGTAHKTVGVADRRRVDHIVGVGMIVEYIPAQPPLSAALLQDSAADYLANLDYVDSSHMDFDCPRDLFPFPTMT